MPAKADAATQLYNFTYPDRQSLMAAGWDFFAVSNVGGLRNTEETSGAVVSYDQTAHPGVLRIPVDSGDLWGTQTNSSDNTVFRTLPSNWTSIQLKIAAFNPTRNNQQAGLVAYQDDDNYVEIVRIYSNDNFMTFDNEKNGNPVTLNSVPQTATSNLYLRLDRNTSTNSITAYYSLDGTTWTSLGSVTQTLNNPRLAIFTGASPGGLPNCDIDWVEVTPDASPSTTLNVFPGTLVFSGVSGVTQSITQTVNVFQTPLQPWQQFAFAQIAGGNEYTDSSGVLWMGDFAFFSGGNTNSTTATITGTTDPTLYQSERYGSFSYNIQLVNGNHNVFGDGNYNVTLKFAEIDLNSAGQRVFNVSMQGTQVISNLDIFAKVGKDAAYDVTIPVSITNGSLNITFTPVIGNAKVSAIEVTPNPGPVQPIKWQPQSDSAWLSAVPSGGTAPGTLAVSADTTGLAGGVYNGTVTVTAPLAANSPQAVSVALIVNPNVPVYASTWKDGHAGAMSVWVDDGDSSCFSNLTGIGVGGTYVCNGDKTGNTTNGGIPSFYTQYYNAGMELGSHLTDHFCTAMPDGLLATDEIIPNLTGICSMTPEPCANLVSMGWPCGYTSIDLEAVASNYYLSARGYNINQLEDTTPADFYNLKCFNSHEHVPYPPANLQTVVDMAVQQGKWANLVFHTTCDDDGAIAYSATKDIWLVPAATVVKYIMQRDRFVLQSYQNVCQTGSFSYNRLGIPSSSYRSFETAFGPQDQVTLAYQLNGIQTVSSVVLNGTSYPYTLKTVNGNTVVLIDAPIDTTTRTVSVSTPSEPFISLSPTGLTFSAMIGTNPASQTITLSNSCGGTMSWTATADSTSPAWLSVSPGSGAGNVNQTLTASVNTAGLAAGTYTKSITISAKGASNTPQTVNVTLTVNAAAPAISLSPTSLGFTTTVGTNPASQTIGLSNSGGGTMSWTATADSTSPAWLSVSPGSGTGNGTLTAAVNAAGLAAGTYNKTITITAAGATNTPQTVNVTLTVNAAAPAISLSPTSLSFTTTVGTNPASQTIGLSNSGGGTMSWTATADSTSPAWLSVSPGSGTGNGTLTAAVNAAGLAAGTYNKAITIKATGATNTPQTVNVTLTVNSVSGNSVFAVNSGGPQYTSTSSGIAYQADTDYSGGTTASTTASISNTSEGTLYQTERYGNFSYSIPLANGDYNVTLKFAEIYWGSAGERVFNVSMQGTQVITNLDIYAQVGKDVAYDVTIPVSVTNGTLNITFTTVVDNAKVSAIAITQGTTACTANAPTVSITPTSQAIASGGSDTYSISIKNNDIGTSCSSTTFNLAASDTNSTNFNASTVSPGSVTLSPGNSGASTLTVTAKAGQTSGTDSTTVTAGASGHTSGVSNAATTTVGTAAVFAVNSGGPQYTSLSSGIAYQADADYSGGTTASTTATISNTSDGTLYQTERYGNFSYSIPLANGNYNVTLKFAEIYWGSAGKRVFNVSMQGTQVITNLDIYAQVGKDVAYDVTIPVSVTNGTLNITFTTVVDNAKVSAIEITQGTTACTANAPTVSITPPSQTIASGGSDTYSISIKNNDIGTSCSSTTFNLAASDTNSTNFNASTVSPGSVTLSPGNSGASTLTVTAQTGQTSGTDSTTVTAGASGHTSGVSNAATTTVGTAAVFAVNSGGPQYTSLSSGITYQADADYSGGTTASTTATISNTSDGALYQTERYGNFSYNIPLANGNYNVTLKFAEIYWGSAGERVFNVSMQGTRVITNLDIYAQVGKDVAYDVTIPVSVTSGTLNITFTTVVDNAKVSAIEITQN